MPTGKLVTCRDDVETLLKNINNFKICPGYGGTWSKSCEIALEGKIMKCKCCRQLQYNDKKNQKKGVCFKIMNPIYKRSQQTRRLFNKVLN